MKIKQYKYIQQEVDSKEFDEPTEPVYFFETGIRRSIRIIPEVSAWVEEPKIYAYLVTCVYDSWECKIEQFNLHINDLEELYHTNQKHSEFVKCWIDGHFLKRDKERFDADLQYVISKLLTP